MCAGATVNKKALSLLCCAPCGSVGGTGQKPNVLSLLLLPQFPCRRGASSEKTIFSAAEPLDLGLRRPEVNTQSCWVLYPVLGSPPGLSPL